MKILMLHPHDIFSNEEPWTGRIRNIAKEFVQRGHEVKLFYFPLDESASKTSREYQGYEVIPLNRKHGPAVLFGNILKVTKAARWADIIHFQKCFHYCALPALCASLFTGKPLHYDWDDWEIKIYYYAPGQSKFIGFFLNLWETSLPKMCETVSYSSFRLKEECIRLGVKEDNMVQAHVGADIEKFRPDIDASAVSARYKLKKHVVMYLGQLHGGQYAELYLNAAKTVLNERDDTSFLVVGGGYRAEELRQLSEKLGINRDVVFTGFLAQDDIPELICASDVCVACFENNDITRCKSPLKIVEYLACGKPIVASNVGEIRNMVGGVGIIVPPGDSRALGDGILRLLSDDALRTEMSSKARERAEKKYNWGVTAENLLKIYRRSFDE